MNFKPNTLNAEVRFLEEKRFFHDVVCIESGYLQFQAILSKLRARIYAGSILNSVLKDVCVGIS